LIVSVEDLTAEIEGIFAVAYEYIIHIFRAFQCFNACVVNFHVHCDKCAGFSFSENSLTCKQIVDKFYPLCQTRGQFLIISDFHIGFDDFISADPEFIPLLSVSLETVKVILFHSNPLFLRILHRITNIIPHHQSPLIQYLLEILG